MKKMTLRITIQMNRYEMNCRTDEKDREVKKMQSEFDQVYQEEYEEAKYKPLIPIVQAYKNVFGVLPDGHPQKEFE